MKVVDDGNFACGIFVDLQKAFDTVDQNILLLSKLSHTGIRGTGLNPVCLNINSLFQLINLTLICQLLHVMFLRNLF